MEDKNFFHEAAIEGETSNPKGLGALLLRQLNI